MGNAITAGAGAVSGGRKAKIMKINGEFFKHGTPAKVGDIIANYPGHILLDSEEFLRFNLRAQPLDPEFELQPKKIYLLVELPRFPTADEADNTLRRTISREIVNEKSHSPVNLMFSQRSVSDLSLTTRSDPEEGPSPSRAAVRVKVKLPKAQVEKILKQSRDDVEAGEKIIDLCMDDGDRAAVPEAEIGEDETTEKVSFSKYMNLHPTLCIPCTNRHSKYKKLTNN